MKKLRLGAVGLGRAFAVMAPTFASDPRVELCAAHDPRPEALAKFERDFAGTGFSEFDAFLKSEKLDAVYIATPHHLHADQARLAAAHKKHVLVEKPMALSLDECRAMIDAARANGVHLVVGHSHSFDAPIALARALIESGDYGRVRMITALDYTDYLYRPRRPEELDTARGGGAVFNQAAHQVDIVRLLGGGRVRSVRAHTGAWDPARPTEGAYSCLLAFEDGAFASLTYSGYAHFDSDELCGWVGEMGQKKDPEAYGAVRRLLGSGPEDELKRRRNYGGEAFQEVGKAPHHQHFGPLIVSCEKADLRPLPHGVMIYADGERRLEPLSSPAIPRREVIDELYGAAIEGRPPRHDGEWALATMEVCLAILQSARKQKEIPLASQTALRT